MITSKLPRLEEAQTVVESSSAANSIHDPDINQLLLTPLALMSAYYFCHSDPWHLTGPLTERAKSMQAGAARRERRELADVTARINRWLTVKQGGKWTRI